jgi:Predicted membrane protein
MWNPFKAISGAIGKAASATGNAVKTATGAIVRTAKAPFSRGEKAPAAPPRQPAPPPARPTTPPPTRPTTPPSAPPAAKEPKLPRSMFPRAERRDERVLGTDSDQERALNQGVKDFEANVGMNGLSADARSFIDHPSFSAAFDKYSAGSGWSSDQWFNGMSNARNFNIKDLDNGRIEVTFDADFYIDGYDVGGRTVTAVF